MTASYSHSMDDDSSLLNEALAYDHWFIGFSGGLDSTALLMICVTFLARQNKAVPTLTAIHINHQVNPASNDWQAHCEAICLQLGVELLIKSITVERNGSGFEADARVGRYKAFNELMLRKDSQSKILLLGHHADDQAETLLLRLMRGTGLRGAAGIPKSRELSDSGVQLLRPLLAHPQVRLQQYVNEQGLIYLDDPSNKDQRFDRNFVRHSVLPMLLTRWPKAKELLTRFADHLRADIELLDDLAKVDLSYVGLSQHGYGESVSLEACGSLPLRRRSNLLRYWFSTHHLSMPSTALMIEVDRMLMTKSVDPRVDISYFQLCVYRDRLFLANRAQLNQLQQCLQEKHHWQLTEPLDSDALSRLTAVRCSGERLLKHGKYWVSNRKHISKVCYRGVNRSLKNVFQEHGVPVWLRDSYPIVYSSNKIAAIPGLLVADDFITVDGYQLVWSWT